MVMKKLLIFALMVVVLAACKQQTREQIAQKLGDAMIKKVEKTLQATQRNWKTKDIA